MPDLTQRQMLAATVARLLIDAEALSAEIGRLAAVRLADADLLPQSVAVVRTLRRMKYETDVSETMHKNEETK